MVHCPIAAVMIHVGSIGAGLDWYQRAFPDAARSTLKVSGFEVLTISGVQIEIVLSDEKVASGPGGAVVYWHVPKLSEALAHMEKIGATLYRGPLEDLVEDWGPEFIERIELMSRQSPPFRHLLGGVWKSSTNEVWIRIEQARGKSW